MGSHIIVAVVLTGGLWWAVPAFGEVKNVQRYGLCTVATNVDPLTDAESPVLRCVSAGGVIMIMHSLSPRADSAAKLSLGITIASMPCVLYEDATVFLRFPSRPLMRQVGLCSRNQVFIVDPAFIAQLLPQLADARQIIIAVGGGIASTLDLTGSARAIRDFQQRLPSDLPQTLEIPAASKLH